MWGNMRKKRGCFIVNCYLGLGAEGGEFRDVIILFILEWRTGWESSFWVFGSIFLFLFFFEADVSVKPNSQLKMLNLLVFWPDCFF